MCTKSRVARLYDSRNDHNYINNIFESILEEYFDNEIIISLKCDLDGKVASVLLADQWQ